MQKIKSTFSAPLLVLVVYVLIVSSRFIDFSSINLKDNIYLSLIIIQVLVFILPGVFYCKLRGSSTEKIKLKKMSVSKFWFVLTCFGVLVFGSTLLNTATYYIFGSQSGYSLYDTFSPSGGSDIVNMIYMVIAFAVLPALTEEFLFRGILLSEYSDYGVVTAMLMSSFMFAMIHFNLNQFIVYFFCGIVTAYTVYITQSLWAAVLLHFLNNVYSLFFESVLWDVIRAPNSLIFFLFVIATLFIVFLVLSFNGAEHIFYSAGIKGLKSPPESQKREGSSIKLFFEALVSPSFLACIVVYLIVTLLL